MNLGGKEMMNITDEQVVRWLLSKAYETGFRYMAMDEDGCVYIYKYTPSKFETNWSTPGIKCDKLMSCLNKIIKPLVSWKDKEPFDIGEYLGIVDWENVPVDTKVLVSDNGESWERRYFKRYTPKNGEYKYICFADGCTFWSDKYNYNGIGWKYCKLAEGE